MKCATCVGAASASKSNTSVPAVVSSTACLFCNSSGVRVDEKKVGVCARASNIRNTSMGKLYVRPL